MPYKDRLAKNANSRAWKKKMRDARRSALGLTKKNYTLTAEQRTEIVRRYLAHPVAMKVLAKEYGVTQPNIWHLLNNRGIPTKTGFKRKYEIDESVFDEITEESAYWAGFLMADGCVGIQKKGGTPIIRLGLHQRDVKHIEKFRLFLKATHSIKLGRSTGFTGYSSSPIATLSFSSRHIAEQLCRFGITPRKSLTAEVRLLENDRHFWRGMVDGDGSLGFWRYGRSRSRRPSINLVGSTRCVKQFSDFLFLSLGIEAAVCPNGKIASISVGGERAVKVIRLLYSDCKISLDRKQRISDQIILDNDSAGQHARDKRLHHKSIDWGKAAAEYASGLTTTALGERLGMDNDTVGRHLKAIGVRMRKGGRRSPCSPAHRKALSEARKRYLSRIKKESQQSSLPAVSALDPSLAKVS